MIQKQEKGAKINAVVAQLQRNPSAPVADVTKAVGFKVTHGMMHTARKKISGGAVVDDAPADEKELRRRLALDMITNHLSGIQRLLMELR